MIIKINIKETSNTAKYHNIIDDIYKGLSQLRKKIKKKYKSCISYEIS